jgi:hypothetical protein
MWISRGCGAEDGRTEDGRTEGGAARGVSRAPRGGQGLETLRVKQICPVSLPVIVNSKMSPGTRRANGPFVELTCDVSVLVLDAATIVYSVLVRLRVDVTATTCLTVHVAAALGVVSYKHISSNSPLWKFGTVQVAAVLVAFATVVRVGTSPAVARDVKRAMTARTVSKRYMV